MKADRFLIIILAGIGILAALAVALFFIRQQNQIYTGDDTPQGVIQNYLVAVGYENYDRAYQYLAQIPNKPNYEQFRQNFLTFKQSAANLSVQVGEATLAGDQANVEVVFLYAGSGPFREVSRQPMSASLARQEGAWKITQFQFPFWDYAWGQAAPTEKPPPAVPAPP